MICKVLVCLEYMTHQYIYIFSPVSEDIQREERHYERDAVEEAPSHSGPRQHPDKADVFIMYATVDGECTKANLHSIFWVQ